MQPLDSSVALIATRSLCGLSLVIQSGEYLALRERLSSLHGRFSPEFFRAVITAQFIFAGIWMLFPSSAGPFATPLFLSALFVTTQLRGSFNGGSDSMTLVVLSALSIESWFPSHPTVTHACLGYIAAQSLLSYVVAGGAKLIKPDWRSGHALRDYLQNSYYGVTPPWRKLTSGRARSFFACWGVMLFELGLTPALFAPRILIGWLALGAAFHLINFFALGLNRFVFAWLATYPALFWLAGRQW